MAPDDGSGWAGRAEQRSGPLIERYREVVVRLEARCRILIGHLKEAALAEPLSPVDQQRRIELLRDILQDDAQIRLRAEPWVLELERLIGIKRAGPSD